MRVAERFKKLGRWARITATAYNHRKFVGINPDAGWMWTMGLSYCADQKTDGFIPIAQAYRLTSVNTARAKKAISELVARAIWDECEDGVGFQVHDWFDYNASQAEIDGVSEVRREAGRSGGRKRQANARQVLKQTQPDVDVDVDEDEERETTAEDLSRSSSRGEATAPHKGDPGVKGTSPPAPDASVPTGIEALSQLRRDLHVRRYGTEPVDGRKKLTEVLLALGSDLDEASALLTLFYERDGYGQPGKSNAKVYTRATHNLGYMLQSLDELRLLAKKIADVARERTAQERREREAREAQARTEAERLRRWTDAGRPCRSSCGSTVDRPGAMCQECAKPCAECNIRDGLHLKSCSRGKATATSKAAA